MKSKKLDILKYILIIINSITKTNYTIGVSNNKYKVHKDYIFRSLLFRFKTNPEYRNVFGQRVSSIKVEISDIDKDLVVKIFNVLHSDKKIANQIEVELNNQNIPNLHIKIYENIMENIKVMNYTLFRESIINKINEESDFDTDIEDDVLVGSDDEDTDSVKKEKSFDDFNETPEYYTDQAIMLIKKEMSGLFDVEETDLELLDERETDMPMSNTYTLKYTDGSFIYSFIVNIPLNQSVQSEQGDEMSTKMVKYCGVKMKKYDLDEKILGQLDKQRVKIANVNKNFVMELSVELDEQLGGGELDIEYQ